jgi:hypothetical protein
VLLEDTEFSYDEVDNPVEIQDWRLPNEWPAGAKPVTRKVSVARNPSGERGRPVRSPTPVA